MYKIGDKLRRRGRHLVSIIYVVIGKEFNDWTKEILYTIERTGFGKQIIDVISEDSLSKDYVKIK